MTPWRVRDFHADDLDAAVRLWDNPAASSEAPAFSLSDLIAAVRSHEPAVVAVVAVVGEELAGAAVATVSGDRAWVMRISLAGAWRHRGIGSAMLGELERRLVAAGVHRIHCLLGGGSEIGALALEHSGYTARQGMVFYERLEPVDPVSAGVLGQLGGRMIRASAWEQLGGMVKKKELIERRVILPLAQPQLAERLGLVPPRAIVLFGPPGTGKSSSRTSRTTPGCDRRRRSSIPPPGPASPSLPPPPAGYMPMLGAAPNATICTASPAVSADPLTAPNGGSARGPASGAHSTAKTDRHKLRARLPGSSLKHLAPTARSRPPQLTVHSLPASASHFGIAARLTRQ